MSGQLERRASEQRFWGWSADPCSADGCQQNQQKSRKDEFNGSDHSAKSREHVGVTASAGNIPEIRTAAKKQLVKSEKNEKVIEDRATIKKHCLPF